MKTILISGVCGGMGATTAKFLLKNGYNVIGIDFKEFCNVEGLEYYKADITSEKALEAVYEQIKDKYRLDVICHFAGFYNMDSLVEITEEEILKIFDVNY